jgi:hypothetical protein
MKSIPTLKTYEVANASAVCKPAHSFSVKISCRWRRAISASKSSWITLRTSGRKKSASSSGSWFDIQLVGFSGSQLLTMTFSLLNPAAHYQRRHSFPEWGYQSGNRKLHPPDALAFCLRYSA